MTSAESWRSVQISVPRPAQLLQRALQPSELKVPRDPPSVLYIVVAIVGQFSSDTHEPAALPALRLRENPHPPPNPVSTLVSSNTAASVFDSSATCEFKCAQTECRVRPAAPDWSGTSDFLQRTVKFRNSGNLGVESTVFSASRLPARPEYARLSVPLVSSIGFAGSVWGLSVGRIYSRRRPIARSWRLCR